MRISSRAVIRKDGNILLMHRIVVKDGETREYYAFPGGGVEDGETLEKTVIRELKEEMDVDIKTKRYLGKSYFKENEKHFFECEIVSGTVKLGGEELERNSPENFYEPVWISEVDSEKFNIIDREFLNK